MEAWLTRYRLAGLVDRPVLVELVDPDARRMLGHPPVDLLSQGQPRSGSLAPDAVRPANTTSHQDHLPDAGGDPRKSRRSGREFAFSVFSSALPDTRGTQHGGTIFCPVKTWNASTFPRHLFHRGESKRKNIPAHTKISALVFTCAASVPALTDFPAVLGLHKFAKSPTPPVHEGYIYLGSHNCASPARSGA